MFDMTVTYNNTHVRVCVLSKEKNKVTSISLVKYLNNNIIIYNIIIKKGILGVLGYFSSVKGYLSTIGL